MRLLFIGGQPLAPHAREQFEGAAMAVDFRTVPPAEFLAALDSFDPALVLIEATSPDPGSLGTMTAIRHRSPHLPVIMLISTTDDAAVAALLDAGANDYVYDDRLGRLPFAVKHALAYAEQSGREADLLDNRRQLSNALALVQGACWRYDIKSGIVTFDDDFVRMFRSIGTTPHDHSMIASAFLQKYVHPDDVALVRNELRAAVLAKEPGYVREIEHRIVYASGEVGWIALRGLVEQNESGENAFILGVNLVITARKKQEDHLREQEALYRGLVEQELSGVAIIGEDGRLKYVNPLFAQFLGFSPAACIGHPIVDFVVDTERQTITDQIEAQHAGLQPVIKQELHVRAQDGKICDVLVNASATIYEGRAATVIVAMDVTQRRIAQGDLERLNRILRTISACNEIVVRSASEAELVAGMCRVAVDVGGNLMAWIGLAEHDAAKSVRAVARAGVGGSDAELAGISWADGDRGQSPMGTAIRTGKLQVNQNLPLDGRMRPLQEGLPAGGFRSVATIPLRNAHDVFGALSIYSGRVDAFGVEELKLLMQLGSDLAFGITAHRNRVAHAEDGPRLERALEGTVEALANTVEQRDPYTAGHQRRVSALAAAIARKMGLPPDAVLGISLAAMIHDIGKIGVPAELLSKPGTLSGLEMQMLQTHAQIGHDIVQGIEFPWPIADMILQHHERLDGSGYPHHLMAKDILLGTKIMSVADVVEAMTARRPYREALGLNAALGEIRDHETTLFDPLVVQTCVNLFHSGEFTFQTDPRRPMKI